MGPPITHESKWDDFFQVPVISMDLWGPLRSRIFRPQLPIYFRAFIGPLLATANVQSSPPATGGIGLPGADALNAQTNELTEVEKPESLCEQTSKRDQPTKI